MHYELQLKYYKTADPSVTAWETIQKFPGTVGGLEDAWKEYRHMTAVDKRRTFRLIRYDVVVLVRSE